MARSYKGFRPITAVKQPTLDEIMEIKKKMPKKLSPLQKVLAERRAAATVGGDEAPLPPADAPKFSDEEDNICPMCGEHKPAADDDGHCSYACASGGGWGGGETPRAHGIPEGPVGLAPSTETGGVEDLKVTQLKHEIDCAEAVESALDAVCGGETARLMSAAEAAEILASLTRLAICGTCEKESCVCPPVKEAMRWITVNERCGLCRRTGSACQCTEDDFCQANADGYFDSP